MRRVARAQQLSLGGPDGAGSCLPDLEIPIQGCCVADGGSSPSGGASRPGSSDLRVPREWIIRGGTCALESVRGRFNQSKERLDGPVQIRRSSSTSLPLAARTRPRGVRGQAGGRAAGHQGSRRGWSQRSPIDRTLRPGRRRGRPAGAGSPRRMPGTPRRRCHLSCAACGVGRDGSPAVRGDGRGRRPARPTSGGASPGAPWLRHRPFAFSPVWAPGVSWRVQSRPHPSGHHRQWVDAIEPIVRDLLS